MGMGRTVLVAEDDLDLLDMVTSILERAGLRVVRAKNGAELVQHLAEDDGIDLVLTDVTMPWMSGAQAALSARNAGLKMPVILMTALRGRALAQALVPLGTNTLVLCKPFGVAELVSTVKSVLKLEA